MLECQLRGWSGVNMKKSVYVYDPPGEDGHAGGLYLTANQNGHFMLDC